MTAEDLQRLHDMVADIKLISRNTGPGASRHEIRHMATQLREIANGQFQDAWRLAGFGRRCMIPSVRLKLQQMTTAKTAYLGGAIDVAGPHALEIFGNGPGGEPVTAPEYAVEFQVIWGEPFQGQDWLDPVDHVEMPLSEYWAACCIWHHGVRVNRGALVRYVANQDGGAHQKRRTERRQPKDHEAALATMKTVQTQFRDRDVLFYAFMSIAQEFTSAPDIAEFVARVEKL